MPRSPWAGEYARTPARFIFGTAPSPLAEEVAALLPADARVLDLGCGEGRDSVFFAGCGFDVTGVDIAQTGLDKAARLAVERGVHARWICADVTRCVLEGAFDLVYSCGVLHYVPRARRARFLARLAAMTRAGGYQVHVVFTDHDVYVEHGESADYFAPGELGRAFAGWSIVRYESGLIECAQDGHAHQHGTEEIVARATGPDTA